MSETTIALISIIGVACVYVLGTIRPYNIGVLGFAFSLIVVTVCGVDINTAIGGFPTSTFIMLAGITYMFTTARLNGSIDLLCNKVLKSIKGRRALLPWIFFIAGALLSACGNGPGAATIILAPTALELAKKANINSLLMGSVLVFGTFAGSLAQINWFGVLVSSSIENLGYSMPGTLLIDSIICNTIAAVVFYILLGGLKLFKKDESAGSVESSAAFQQTAPATLEQKVTFLAILALIICGAVFAMNVGFTSFLLGLILNLFNPKREAQVIKEMPWSTIVLVSGIVTLVTLMDNLGGTDLVVDAITAVVPSAVAPLVLLMLAGLASFYATSSAVIVAFAPMAIQLMETIGSTNVAGMLAALVIASTMVDCSPLAINGAALVANVQAEDKQVFFKKLMVVGLVMVPIGSILGWLLFYVLGL